MEKPASPWAVLKHAPFARYMTGETISMLGTWMQMMAQSWVVAGLTKSNFTLGLLNFASGIPMLVFASWGGVLADRHDKRRILLLTQIVQIITAVSLGWLVYIKEISVWHILIAGVCLGTSAAFEMPAASALIPELVGRERLRAAISVDRSLFHATRTAGPALGGWLMQVMGTASAFFANAASFLAMIIALFTLPSRPVGTAEEEAQRQTGMSEGWKYIRGDRPTRTMILLLMSITTCISPFFMITMSNFCRYVLHVPEEKFGILMASSGVGAFVGSLWLLRIAGQHRRTYLRGAAAIIALAMFGFSQARNLYEAMAALVFMTGGTSTLFGLANTIVQERAPDALRGRVSALTGMSFFGVLPFSGLLVAAIADSVGLRQAMGGAALLFGLAATAILYRYQHACEEQPVAGKLIVES
ncbi:MFS transporter [Chthoniobacter flavus]|uniref:MFS transporter n=1 Tax=Chthoniobacter flavus TaxID=191863 RepID=UPI000679D999|nr:MFS transporter [Chthoniobacter flavus]